MKKNIGSIAAIVVVVLFFIASLVFQAGLPFAPKPEPATAAPSFTPAPTNTPQPTFTPDPCSSERLPDEVARVHLLTREFEDNARILTSTLFRDTSVPLIQELQRIRRVAEDQSVPDCLKNLKKAQIIHMNARIDVFGVALSFLNLYGPNGDQNLLNQQLAPFYLQAELAAHQYEVEYSLLLGLPTPTPLPIVTVTPAP